MEGRRVSSAYRWASRLLRADNLLRETYPYHPVRESIWQDTAELRQRLADKGWHQCASPVDLMVALTAARMWMPISKRSPA
ncbi:hypothetical protein Vqi01_31270 [Micromonospora qiuiae]|uniref:Uncharacterized protein n=1 Tax=Micromonospora qiuiae TaxID=502268 RepID=A0ABQ4JDD3_9ACTN|nr:hypothetical protein Vqi01_31270 [Micromonospora qiuiae]